MHLGDHFKQIKKKYHNTFFSGICFDHRKIKKNYIFFAIKGNNLDDNNFIVNGTKWELVENNGNMPNSLEYCEDITAKLSTNFKFPHSPPSNKAICKKIRPKMRIFQLP